MKISKSGILKLKIKLQKKSLSVFSYFEWCLGSSSDHHREFHKTFLETHFDPNLNCMTATKRLWEIPLGVIEVTGILNIHIMDLLPAQKKYQIMMVIRKLLLEDMVQSKSRWNICKKFK